MTNTNQTPTPTSRPIPDVSAITAQLRKMANNMRETADHVDAMADELLRLRDVEAVITQAQALAQYINTLGLTGAAASAPDQPSSQTGDTRPDGRDPPAPKPEPRPKPKTPVAGPAPRASRAGSTRDESRPFDRTKPEPKTEPAHPSPSRRDESAETPSAPNPEPSVAVDLDAVNQTLENMLPPDMRNASFGRRLSVTRSIRELSLSDVTEATGIDEASLRRLEQNQAAPTSDQLDKLSDILDTSRSDLVTAPMTKLAPLASANSTGARIRLVRIRAGLTQTTLAKRLDVQNHVVDDYESDSGERPNLEHLAVALNVDKNVFTAFIPNAPAFALRPAPAQRPGYSLDALANHPSTGRKIWNLRVERGLSIEELARHAGISASHLNQIENGAHNPRESTIQALARALRVAPLDIIGEPSMNTARVQTVRADADAPRPEMRLDKREPRPTKEAKALRRARLIMSMSTRELADTSGVPESVIRDIESGRTVPTKDIISSLVTALPVSEDDIYQNRV